MNARSVFPTMPCLWGLAALVICSAGAADPGKNAVAATAPMVRREMVDGKLTQPASADALIKPYDLNGDGKLDEDEIRAMQAKIGNVRPAFSGTNHSQFERKITRSELVNVPAPGTKGGKDDAFFHKYDLNNDGVLDASEIAAAKADMLTHQPVRSMQTRSVDEPPAAPAPVADPPAGKSGKPQLVDPLRSRDKRIR